MIKVFLYGGEGIGSSIDDNMVYLKNMLATRENIKLVKTPLFADIVHIVWWNQFKKIKNFKRISTAKWIAVASNEIQDNNKDFVEAENIVDYWISYNKKQHEWFLNKSLKSFLMPLYVDKNIFYSNENSKVEMANSLGIDINLIQNRKLIGSFQRDSNGSNLFLPKWQKNPELLVDILIALSDRVGDKNWCLILAGPRRHWILNSCVENKIPFVYVGKPPKDNEDDVSLNTLNKDIMRKLYNLIDIYIISSKSEGGPKAAIEAPLCKTLTISTRVGMSPDLLNKDCIFNSIDEAVFLLESLIKDDLNVNKVIKENYKKISKICSKSNRSQLLEEVYHYISKK